MRTKTKPKKRRGMSALEVVLVVAIALPMAAWMYRYMSKLFESLFYMIGTIVGSAYL